MEWELPRGDKKQNNYIWKSMQIANSKSIPISLRKRFAKCFIGSVVMFGTEIFTFKKKEEKYLESVEMWL